MVTIKSPWGQNLQQVSRTNDGTAASRLNSESPTFIPPSEAVLRESKTAIWPLRHQGLNSSCTGQMALRTGQGQDSTCLPPRSTTFFLNDRDHRCLPLQSAALPLRDQDFTCLPLQCTNILLHGQFRPVPLVDRPKVSPRNPMRGNKISSSSSDPGRQCELNHSSIGLPRNRSPFDDLRRHHMFGQRIQGRDIQGDGNRILHMLDHHVQYCHMVALDMDPNLVYQRTDLDHVVPLDHMWLHPTALHKVVQGHMRIQVQVLFLS
ncbi:hypothetical protein BC567DRAFT_259864 [Phyllosticta citribraziliensis]